ncbi:hypothetical protein F7725_021805 [Dissostichus mawsoni]|uniref:Sushi domain-containing protein n=1 Tax=Dissostichus mawsoni TaxID=36200 RepID=A0A7J5ZCN3_DISMA|nr:hypothetical protein F7725_021805 [Dissostichus mawsoni]
MSPKRGPPTRSTQLWMLLCTLLCLSCIPVLPPRRGSFYVESGTVSIGSVLAFWCREGYQLVGSDKISCYVKNGRPQWSNYLPRRRHPRHVSVLPHLLPSRAIRSGPSQEGGTEQGDAQGDALQPAQPVLAGERRGRVGSFPSSQDFHLSQRMNPRLAPDGPLYLTGSLGGYENRGYQRSQESLLKASLPGLYRSESQLYPHVVLQRVPTPTAPSAPSAPLYLHLPSSSSTPAHAAPYVQPHLMAQYPIPTYPPHPNPHPTPAPIYPNPNPTPQRPWQ